MKPLHKTALISRTGIYDYLAGELPGSPAGLPPGTIVKVYRDAAEVFDKEALASFEYLPLTIDHPPAGVTPENFSKVAHGFTHAPVVKDGAHARVGVTLASAEILDAYAKGRRELSAGYTMQLVWKSGMTADGVPYDAEQRQIRGNHIALVKAGRAGSARVTDEKRNIMDEKELKALLDELKAGLKEARDGLKAAQDSLAAVTKERDELKTKLDGMKTLDEQVAEGVKKAVAEKTARDAAIDKAKIYAPKLEVKDETTLRQVQEAAVKAARPDLALDGKEDLYVSAVFDALPNEKREPAAPKSPVGKMMTAAQIRDALAVVG